MEERGDGRTYSTWASSSRVEEFRAGRGRGTVLSAGRVLADHTQAALGNCGRSAQVEGGSGTQGDGACGLMAAPVPTSPRLRLEQKPCVSRTNGTWQPGAQDCSSQHGAGCSLLLSEPRPHRPWPSLVRPWHRLPQAVVESPSMEGLSHGQMWG